MGAAWAYVPSAPVPPPPPLSPRNLVVLIYAAFSFYSNFPCFFYPTFLFPVQGIVDLILFCFILSVVQSIFRYCFPTTFRRPP